MKKILYIFLLLAIAWPMMAGIHSYTDQSVLHTGNWVKIRVSESGVCKMTFSQLEQAGLNPQELRVYGYGGAVLDQDFMKKKIDDLPQVPVYVGDGYVLFWVQGTIAWSYTGARFVHTRNTYSDYGYYLLTDNVGERLAPTEGTAISGTATDIYDYIDYQVHDYDSLNLIDRTGVSGGGRYFYGEQFNGGQKRSFLFDTPNAIADEVSQLYVDAAAYSKDPSYFEASLNGNATSKVYIKAYADFYTMACTGTINLRGMAAADKQQVDLLLRNNTPGSLGWLNYIELATPSTLTMRGSWMPIRSISNYRSATPVRFHLSGATENTQIWDITALDHICRMPTHMENDRLVWTGSQLDGIHEYVAVNPQGTEWVRAEVVGKVKNQNLHALRNIDYVIICPEGYESVSEQLARAHEAKQAITWAVVTDQQVYNEFSSGTPDASAYRWLMKMLYDRADEVNAKPRWLLLMGHGSYDNRKLLPTSGTNTLLSYQSLNSVNEVNGYATDDYFGFLDDFEGAVDTAGTMDIGVGRMPVGTVKEAQEVVDKTIRYISNSQPGKWKNQLVFLADDGENGTHTETSEAGAELVRIKNPDFVVNKIFLDAYPQEVNASGESYPLAKNKLTNMLKNGVLFFDYAGHGGYNAITNEGVLNMKDIDNMTNKNLGFWLFATCNFGQCDAGRRCSAEAAVLNPNGGAIAVLSATRTVYAQQNTNLNRAICDTLFGHSNVFHYDMTIGEATAAGKNKLRKDVNKMAYLLLGDPAVRLNYPTDYQVETTTRIDTLNALSVQEVEGRIIDEDSLTVSDFNGQMDITIYDKIQIIKTRDNDNDGEEAQEIAYKDYPSTIFSGSTEVKEGTFRYQFMVPKDIRYNFGPGRIVYYAHTEDNGNLEEAIGHFEQFIIGGTGNILSADTIGPQMRIYLNTTAFLDGDKTYPTPRFYAELYDENGINTAGAGIGHDLMLVIDDNPNLTYSLNAYFTSANDSYQGGMVSYMMEALSDGPHSLTFRAWDLLNNSTTQTLHFIVEKGLAPSICSVTTYPNPADAQGLVHIDVLYDQPDELLQTELYLYSIGGQLVWTHTQNNPENISINLPAIGLQPGVYVYHIKLKSANSRYSTASGKIIITK